MVWFDWLLRACYFFAMVALFIYGLRAFVDWHRNHQGFRLIDMVAFGSLVVAVLLIAVSAGQNPRLSGDYVRIAIRLAFMSFAILGTLSGALYVWAIFVVQPVGASGQGTSRTGTPFRYRVHWPNRAREYMIGTATSIISINYTYTPKLTTAQTVTCIANCSTVTCPASWFSPIIRDWNTPEEDEAWRHLNDGNAPTEPATK